MNRAIFLDRDGTIIEEKNYLRRTEDVRLIPGAAVALRALQRAGYLLVVVTNQSGIGRGLMTLAEVENVHRYLADLLERQGVTLSAIYLCPHHPDDQCDCRKPSPKLFLTAAKAQEIDLAESFAVGDKLSDIQAGQQAGCVAILVETGWGKKAVADFGAQLRDVPIVKDLAAAAKLILKTVKKEAVR